MERRRFFEDGEVEEPSSEGLGMSMCIFKVPRMMAGVGIQRQIISQVSKSSKDVV